MGLKFEKKDVMIYVLIILVVLLSLNSFNQRNDIINDKKKYQDKIENYKNQIEGVQFYAKGLEKKINTKDGQIDSITDVSNDNLKNYLKLKKKLNEINLHNYANISDEQLIDKLSGIKFNAAD